MRELLAIIGLISAMAHPAGAGHLIMGLFFGMVLGVTCATVILVARARAERARAQAQRSAVYYTWKD